MSSLEADTYVDAKLLDDGRVAVTIRAIGAGLGTVVTIFLTPTAAATFAKQVKDAVQRAG